MLDVHPAHHAANGWRDFLVHIATIVIGLLIAISLEQMVEYVHHRHQAAEAREQLHLESERTHEVLELNIFTTEHHEQQLKNDLVILGKVRMHQPVGNAAFYIRRFGCCSFPSDAWKTIHSTGTVNYLTRDDLLEMEYLYTAEEGFNTRLRESKERLMHAGALLVSANDPPRASVESTVTNAQFLDSIGPAHGELSQAAVDQGYKVFLEHADLSRLSAEDLDTLERGIKTCVVDDEFLMTDLSNIKRTLTKHAARGY